MNVRLFLSAAILLCFLSSQVQVQAQVQIDINPETSVSIDGVLDLDRSQFINLGDVGWNMESTINDQSQVDYYTDDLQFSYGRLFGGGVGVVNWTPSANIVEDSTRPGYADIPALAASLNPGSGGSSASFISKYSPNIGLAAHDRYGAYPDFMPMWYASGDDPDHDFPVNTDAAGEWIAAVLEHNYTDWTRPLTYELINEPSWRVWGDQRFADWHTAVKAKVDAAGLDVDVGGPCMSVGYFYKNNYRDFSMRSFIDRTGCNLDFYSFHVYDYMHWDYSANDFKGRVSTGLPVEGVLDLIQNYTINQYGKEVDIVLSEHGGYISSDQEGALDHIANTYFPYGGGTPDFAWELKRRSVNEFLAVSSEIANTMAFMNHPHVVRKSVPFILLQSANWNPQYYSTLLVKEDFNRNSNIWHESKYINFFKYFKNVSGRRVQVQMDDPDIQCHSYVNGDKLYILMNNLDDQAAPLSLNIPTTDIQSITLRRFGRNPDFTPYFTETTVGSLAGLQIEGREAVAVEVDYASSITETQRLNEVPYYGNAIQQVFSGGRVFSVRVPEYRLAQTAKLRIGVGRGTGTDHRINVTFNGTALTVPLEDCADYLENNSEYGSTKFINVPANLLQENNSVAISFPSGSGGIGAVVLRAALIPNDHPSFNSSLIAEVAATEDAPYSATVADDAIDTDGDTLVFSKVSGPDWLDVAVNGMLSGTPSNADVGLNSWSIQVGDGKGGSDTATLEVTVYNANDAPVFSVAHINKQNAEVGSAYSNSVDGIATDVDVGDLLTYSKLSGPGWLNVATNGALSGTPAGSDLGINNWMVRVSDGNGGTDDAELEVRVVDDAGIFILNPVADAYVQGATYATSNFGASTVLYCKTDGSENTTYNFLRFDLSSETGPYTNVILRLKVESAEGTGDIHAALFVSDDSWGEDTLTWNNKPAGEEMLDTELSSFVGDWIELNVTDKINTEVSTDKQFSVAIVSGGSQLVGYHSKEAAIGDRPELIIQTKTNAAPIFTMDPINKPGAEDGTSYSGTIAGSAIDMDAGDTLTYSKDSGPAWLNVAANGDLSGVPGPGDVGANQFSIRVEDSTLESDTATLNVTVGSASTPSGYDAWSQQYSIDGAGMTVDSDLDGENNLAEYLFGGNPTNMGLVGYRPGLNEAMEYVYVLADDPSISYLLLMSTNLAAGFNMTNTDYLGSSVYGPGLMIHSNMVETTTEELFLKLDVNYSE